MSQMVLQLSQIGRDLGTAMVIYFTRFVSRVDKPL
jgi:hypothetical protein